MSEPKVMWSARFPGELIDQIKAAAEEDGISEAELVQPWLEEALDQRELERGRRQ